MCIRDSRQVVACDVELLVVCAEDLLCRLRTAAGGGEDHLSQRLEGDVGDPGHAVGHVDVPLGAGGRLEHDRIGDDGRGHQSRHLGGGHQALVLIHPRHDGGGAAHGLVPDSDGILGLDVRQPVVVDDCLLYTSRCV